MLLACNGTHTQECGVCAPWTTQQARVLRVVSALRQLFDISKCKQTTNFRTYLRKEQIARALYFVLSNGLAYNTCICIFEFYYFSCCVCLINDFEKRSCTRHDNRSWGSIGDMRPLVQLFSLHATWSCDAWILTHNPGSHRVCVCVCVRVCVWVRAGVCMSVWLCACVFAYVRMYK